MNDYGHAHCSICDKPIAAKRYPAYKERVCNSCRKMQKKVEAKYKEFEELARKNMCNDEGYVEETDMSEDLHYGSAHPLIHHIYEHKHIGLLIEKMKDDKLKSFIKQRLVDEIDALSKAWH